MKNLFLGLLLVAGWLTTSTSGSAYYDPETGTFLTRDPAGFIDGPNVYTYVRQNPWTKFDPEGLNEVVVSGGIDTTSPKTWGSFFARQLRNRFDFEGMVHDVKWSNFIDAAEANIQNRQKAGDTQKIEWDVQKSTYETRAVADGLSKDAYTKQIEQKAKADSVDLRWYNDSKELIKDINTNEQGKPRQGDEKISDYTQYSHGYPGKMATDYNGGTEQSLTTGDIKAGVQRSAFQDKSTSELYPCNSASMVNKESVKEMWQATTGSTTAGVVGRMDYASDSRHPAPTAAGAHWDPAPPNAPPQKNL